MVDPRREVISDTLMDCRVGWPWGWTGTLTYQEAMRKLADTLIRELDKSAAPRAATEPRDWYDHGIAALDELDRQVHAGSWTSEAHEAATDAIRNALRALAGDQGRGSPT